MKVIATRLQLYRSLYWANQAMLAAIRYLEEAENPSPGSPSSSELLNHQLSRTKAMIQETRDLMNRTLGEWVERQE